MTTKDIIETLKVIKAMIEWEHPLDHVITIDEAIKKLELMEEKDDKTR